MLVESQIVTEARSVLSEEDRQLAEAAAIAVYKEIAMSRQGLDTEHDLGARIKEICEGMLAQKAKVPGYQQFQAVKGKNKWGAPIYEDRPVPELCPTCGVRMLTALTIGPPHLPGCDFAPSATVMVGSPSPWRD
jgi:hypothetical protein